MDFMLVCSLACSLACLLACSLAQLALEYLRDRRKPIPGAESELSTAKRLWKDIAAKAPQTRARIAPMVKKQRARTRSVCGWVWVGGWVCECARVGEGAGHSGCV